MKFNSILVTFILPFIFGCTNDTDNPPQPEVFHCKLLKYGKLATYNNEVQYQNGFLYQNDVMTKRLNYGNTLSSSTGMYLFGIQSKDSIVYNSRGNTEKIFYRSNRYDVFYYEGNSKNPNRREGITVGQNGYIDKWIENITYDTSDRISKTEGYYPDFPGELKIKNNYIYDSTGNLNQTIEEKVDINNNIKKTIVTYSNFDTAKNPFKNIDVPFIEYRHLKYSQNNYRKFESITTFNGKLDNFNNWEISAYSYNEYDYPLFGEYECQ